MNPLTYIRRAYVLPKPSSLLPGKSPRLLHCPECGYEMGTLDRCPECGLSHVSHVEYGRRRDRAYRVFVLGIVSAAVGTLASLALTMMLAIASHPRTDLALLPAGMNAVFGLTLVVVGPRRLLRPEACVAVTFLSMVGIAAPIGFFLRAR